MEYFNQLNFFLNFFQISEKHRRMQLLEYLYGGSTLWHKHRITRSINEDTLFTLSPPPAKTISLMFRTVKSDGILIYAATNKHYTSVEVNIPLNIVFQTNPKSKNP